MSYETLQGDMSLATTRTTLRGVAVPTTLERTKAVRCLAVHAADARELSEWLEMLDLSAAEGKAPG